MEDKGYMVFSVPALLTVYENLVYGTEIDFTVLIVAVITCIIGSSIQIAHKNLDAEKKGKTVISKSEIYAIYTTGVVFGVLAYYVGYVQQNILYTMGIGIMGSYMSLDIFFYARLAVIAIIKQLPSVFIDALRNKLNSTQKKENE